MQNYEGHLAGNGLKFAIVASRYNDFITDKLVRGATECLLEAGVSDEDIAVYWCPGALEIPALAARIISTKKPDGLVCIGCVIRGETDHYQFVASESVGGISRLALDTKVAIGNAILTVENAQQAIERSGERNRNKGWEAAAAALQMADLFRKLT
jgi:6,7-dimethyl-8-ribityllumazine synthase